MLNHNRIYMQLLKCYLSLKPIAPHGTTIPHNITLYAFIKIKQKTIQVLWSNKSTPFHKPNISNHKDVNDFFSYSLSRKGLFFFFFRVVPVYVCDLLKVHLRGDSPVILKFNDGTVQMSCLLIEVSMTRVFKTCL